MRIAVTYGPMCLQRSAKETWSDPRTGSEIGWRQIVDGLREMGHRVVTENDGFRLPDSAWDAVISINEPDELRRFPGAKLRVCMFWLNGFSFCKEGFDQHVDAYFSPSESHREQALGSWGAVSPAKWGVNLLGCDTPAATTAKVPGRVVYCSSPDRGLHRALEAWPAIKRAVPHATLKVFYRLEPWLRQFDQTPYYPPIERNRTRALYIEEALRRLSGPEWGIEVVDSVSHSQVLLEMAQAEVLLHPCETMSWSEGFSVTCMDACSRGAVPVLTDCDALGEVYTVLDPIPVGNWDDYTARVVRTLTDSEFRGEMKARALALAERTTWTRHVKQLEQDILAPR